MEPVVFPTFPIFSSFLCAKEGSPSFGSDSLCHCCFTPVSVFSCFLLSCTRCSRCNRRRNRHSLYSRDVFRLFYSEPVCKSGTDNIRSPESELLHLPSCIPPCVLEKAGHQKCPAPPFLFFTQALVRHLYRPFGVNLLILIGIWSK